MLAGLVVLTALLSAGYGGVNEHVFIEVDPGARSGSVSSWKSAPNTETRVLLRWQGRIVPIERLRKEIWIPVNGSIDFNLRIGKSERGRWRLDSYRKRILADRRPLFICGSGLYDDEYDSYPARFRMVARRKGRTNLSFVYSEPGRPAQRRFSVPIVVSSRT